MSHTHVVFNGTLIPEDTAKLSIHDLAIVRGYGIFDFFKTVKGIPYFLDDNLDRFYRSAELMDLPVNYSRKELKSLIQDLMAANAIPDSGIKILLTGGISSDGYSIGKPNLIISQHPIARNVQQESEGLRLLPFEYHRPFSQVKSIDYVMGIQALKAAKSQQADDVVYMKNGFLSECPRANFFLVTADGTLLTAGDDVLQGITRMKILMLAKANNIKLKIKSISLADLNTATEAFITSTTKNITPVTSLVGYKDFKKGAGPITKTLQMELDKLIYQI